MLQQAVKDVNRSTGSVDQYDQYQENHGFEDIKLVEQQIVKDEKEKFNNNVQRRSLIRGQNQSKDKIGKAQQIIHNKKQSKRKEVQRRLPETEEELALLSLDKLNRLNNRVRTWLKRYNKEIDEHLSSLMIDVKLFNNRGKEKQSNQEQILGQHIKANAHLLSNLTKQREQLQQLQKTITKEHYSIVLNEDIMATQRKIDELEKEKLKLQFVVKTQSRKTTVKDGSASNLKKKETVHRELLETKELFLSNETILQFLNKKIDQASNRVRAQDQRLQELQKHPQLIKIYIAKESSQFQKDLKEQLEKKRRDINKLQNFYARCQRNIAQQCKILQLKNHQIVSDIENKEMKANFIQRQIEKLANIRIHKQSDVRYRAESILGAISSFKDTLNGKLERDKKNNELCSARQLVVKKYFPSLEVPKRIVQLRKAVKQSLKKQRKSVGVIHKPESLSNLKRVWKMENHKNARYASLNPNPQNQSRKYQSLLPGISLVSDQLKFSFQKPETKEGNQSQEQENQFGDHPPLSYQKVEEQIKSFSIERLDQIRSIIPRKNQAHKYNQNNDIQPPLLTNRRKMQKTQITTLAL